MSLLEVKDLKINFSSSRGFTNAVKGIDFEIAEGESVAIVGESGSGKSVTAMSLSRLLPQPEPVRNPPRKDAPRHREPP